MSRIKMVLMLVLLLATVVTTVTTFGSRNGLVAKAACPAVGESVGACHPNPGDANFSTCGSAQYDPNDLNIPVCFVSDCSYTDPHGNTVSGSCCTGGSCRREE